MSDIWLYQVRIKVTDKLSTELRNKEVNDTTQMVYDIAKKFATTPVCTYDAFKAYCKEAEDNGVDQYPLYQWTKDTIENPQKKKKHLKSFAFYTESSQVYEKETATALYNELSKMLKEGLIEDLQLIDSNPKNNPQPPKKYQSP